MYLTFYGLTEKPFNATPDPRFLYASPAHREALAQLQYGVQERKGFIVLTGRVGTGKTTLLRALRQRLEGRTAVASVVNSSLPFDGILECAFEDLGIAKPGASRERMTSGCSPTPRWTASRSIRAGSHDASTFSAITASSSDMPTKRGESIATP